MSTGTIASKESRFRKKFDKKSYDFNYDRIFRKASKDKKAIIYARSVKDMASKYRKQLTTCKKNLDKKKYIIF